MAGPDDYPEYMQPIDFPTADVQAAADRCRSVAQVLSEAMDVASDAASVAIADWRGVYADDFDVAWPGTEMSATDLEERLLRLAGDLEDAIDGAEAENTRRAGLRAQLDCQNVDPNMPC